MACCFRVSLVATQYLQTACQLLPAVREQVCRPPKGYGFSSIAASPSVAVTAFQAVSQSRAFAASSAHPTSSSMTPQLAPRAQAVLDYWLGDNWESAAPGDTLPHRSSVWFKGGPEVDADIISRFKGDCEALLRGDYDSWQHQPLEALAGIVLGDQLARNTYRGTAAMYAADPKVLSWSKALVASGAEQLTPIQRVWCLMPFMHSEELADQEECVARFAKLSAECEASGLHDMAKMTQQNVQYAKMHRDAVRQWGRFPHRNAILGRESTAEEAAAIADGTMPKW